MKLFALPRAEWGLIGAGAILTVLAYPPFHLFVPSFLCLVPAVRLIADGQRDARPMRRHLVQGFWFGAAANALVLYWMLIGLWHFTWAISFGYAATVIALGVFTAALFAVSGWIVRRTRVSLLVAFPLLWTAMEWGVGHLGDVRFPWLGLGTSLTGYPTAVQLADVVGARGITLLLAVANVALALAWVHAAERRRAAGLVGGVLLGVAVAFAYGVWRERTLPVRPVGVVTVLQPNIGFDEKWRGDRVAVFEHSLALADSALAVRESDLVIWPEAAVPAYLRHTPEWAARIGALSGRSGTPQLVGALDAELEAGEERSRIYNAAFLFDELGRTAPYPVYHKQYLVPITERVPFFPPEWFPLAFFGSFAVGDRGPVYRTAIGAFGVLICYESIFENLARDYRRRGADFLVNITNDAWFGRTSATYQHAAHLTMRAIETRAGVARAANTGISGFVDPLGRQYGRTGLYVEATATDTLSTTDVIPLYVRLGDWVGLVALVGSAALVGLAWRERG